MLMSWPEKSWYVSVAVLHLNAPLQEALPDEVEDMPEIGMSSKLEDFMYYLIWLTNGYDYLVIRVSRSYEDQQFFVSNGQCYFPEGGSLELFSEVPPDE
jgi:hypothetical protein